MEKIPHLENESEVSVLEMHPEIAGEDEVVDQLEEKPEEVALTDDEKIQEIKASLAQQHAPEMNSPQEGKKEAVVVPLAQPQENPTWYEKLAKKYTKAAAILGITAASFLPAKEAKGQQKMHSDREGMKVEVGTTNKTETTTVNTESYELSQKEATDWNEYLDFLDGKKLRGSVLLDKKDFSEKIMKEFLTKHKDNSLSPEMVMRVQSFLQTYKKQLDAAERKAETDKIHPYSLMTGIDMKEKIARGDTVPEKFMVGIEKTKRDKYPGSITTRFKIPRSTLTVEEKTVMHDRDSSGKLVVTSEATKIHKEDKGFVTLASATKNTERIGTDK